MRAKSKPTTAEQRKAAQVEDRVRRARPAREDASGECRAALAELAEATGRPLAQLVEEWSERAAVREYLGSYSRDDAELLALEDVRDALGWP